MATQKTPVDLAVAAFGGIKALAKAANIPEKRIYRWRYPKAQGGSDGRIPADQQGKILAAARADDLPLTAEQLIDSRDVPKLGRRRKPVSKPARERVRA